MPKHEPGVLVCISDRKIKANIKKRLQKRSEILFEDVSSEFETENGMVRHPVLVVFDAGFLKQFNDQSLVEMEKKTGSAPWVIIVGGSDKRYPSQFRKLIQIRNDSLLATLFLFERHIDSYFDQIYDYTLTASANERKVTSRLHEARKKLRLLENQTRSIAYERSAMTANEKDEVFHQMSASINHEINNPLAVILGQIEILLLKKEVLPGIMVDRLEAMNSAGKRIQAITEKLRSVDYTSLVEYVGDVQMIDIGKRKKSGKGFSVLVVDDEYYMSDLFKEILENESYLVRTVDSGISAVQAASQQTFDAALVDLKMPVMDGVETIRSLKEVQPEMKIIIHTGYVNDERIKQALSSGAERLLYKPFKQEYLLELLNEVISL